MQRVPSENRWLSLSAGFVATTLNVGCAPYLDETEAELDAGDGQCAEYCDGVCCAAVEQTESDAPIVRPLRLTEEPQPVADVPEVESKVPERSPRRARRRRARRRATPAEVLISAEAGAAGVGTYGSTRGALEDAADSQAHDEEDTSPSLSVSGRGEDPMVRSLQKAVDSGHSAAWSAPIGAAYAR